MKKESTYYEKMEENYRKKEFSKACKTFACISIPTVVVFLSALTLFVCCSCSSDETTKEPEKGLYWQTRHDAIPEQFKGYWCSVSDKTTPVLNVTDKFVMTAHFTINREQDNVVRINDSILHMYQGGKFFALAFRVNGQLEITAFNDCYDTVVLFETVLPEPIEPVQPEPQEPVFN